jgi:hypothetical protein
MRFFVAGFAQPQEQSCVRRCMAKLCVVLAIVWLLAEALIAFD